MKQKQSKADFLRSWGLPYPSFQYHHLRYKNPPEKGVYWYYYSLYVRARDVEKYGTCISCGREIDVETSDAGHFMPAYDCGRDLLFNEFNVNAECAHCNGWDRTHLLGYAEGLDERFGKGTAQRIRDARAAHLRSEERVKDWSRKEYAQMVKNLIKKYDMKIHKVHSVENLGI